MEEQANMHRIAAYRIHQSLVGKDALPLNKFWPLHSDEATEVKKVMTKEMLAEIARKHGLKHIINE